MVANLFSMIGYCITFALSFAAFSNENWMLAYSLFGAGFIFASAHFLNGFVKHQDSYKVSAIIVQICLIALMIYLVYSGGKNNTGPLWIYIVPPVMFFFGGLKKGLINLSLFVIVIGAMLFYPSDSFLATSYSFDFASRTLFSFLTVSLLSGFYEYSRQQAIDNIQRLSNKYERQAMTDPLTRIPNRRGMKEHLQYEHNRSSRSVHRASLLLCDVDHFKSINDELGHEGGDNALVKLTRLLKENLREQDKCARWGGEEFLVLLPETSPAEAYLLAERLRRAVEKMTIGVQEQQMTMSISIGIALLDTEQSIDKAVNEADKNLYKAKESGRNRVYPNHLKYAQDAD
jgi:diguanylate cyclase (GGDEF)-like protein